MKILAVIVLWAGTKGKRKVGVLMPRPARKKRKNL
jgi:hypothetical protein